MGAKGPESCTREEIHDANQPKSTQVNPLLVSLPIVALLWLASRIKGRLSPEPCLTTPGIDYTAEHQ
jgi:hypothetical protein